MLEACARAMAERFQAGGRLWTIGNGGSACDAQHVAVEFLHPIIEKRRALPARRSATRRRAADRGRQRHRLLAGSSSRQLELLARAGDVVARHLDLRAPRPT